MSQFCTCHDSIAVMAYAKLWHDWVTIFPFIAINIFEKKRKDYEIVNHVWDGFQEAVCGPYNMCPEATSMLPIVPEGSCHF